MNTNAIGTAAIGSAGELLVQYKLLKYGIDSARLTVDNGIDLVMYLPTSSTAATIQVKTKQKAVPAGGTGKLSLGWFFPDSCPAQWLAFTDLSTDSAWLFTIDQARDLAQQYNTKGDRQLYWYVDEMVAGSARRQSEVECYRIDNVVARLLNA
jgi:hypothetical protein